MALLKRALYVYEQFLKEVVVRRRRAG